MKILFLTNLCPPYRLPLFETLSREYDVCFVFTKEGSLAAQARGSYSGWTNFGKLRYSLCLTKIRLALKLLGADYDVLVADFPVWDSWFEFIIARLRRKRVIFWVEEWHQPRTLIRNLSSPILRYMANSCDAIVASGSAAKAHMIDYGAISQKIFIAPDVSEVEEVPKRTSKARALASSNNFVILYLGRLVRYKGAEYLIKAFSRLEKERDNVKLVIVGNGNFRSVLEQMVQELELQNVELIGACDDRNKPLYYSMCDLFVLPSIWQHDYCEAWGLVLNEVMQFGKPVIATDAVGSAFDLIKNGVNGYMVRNTDVDSLYQAIKKIVENPKLAKTMGVQSKRIIEEGFTYTHMIRGFKDAISFVKQNPRNKRGSSE